MTEQRMPLRHDRPADAIKTWPNIFIFSIRFCLFPKRLLAQVIKVRPSFPQDFCFNQKEYQHMPSSFGRIHLLLFLRFLKKKKNTISWCHDRKSTSFLKIFLSFSKDTARTRLDRAAISIISLRFFLSFLKGLPAWQHMLSTATINIKHIYICFLLDLAGKLKKKKKWSFFVFSSKLLHFLFMNVGLTIAYFSKALCSKIKNIYCAGFWDQIPWWARRSRLSKPFTKNLKTYLLISSASWSFHAIIFFSFFSKESCGRATYSSEGSLLCSQILLLLCSFLLLPFSCCLIFSLSDRNLFEDQKFLKLKHELSLVHQQPVQLWLVRAENGHQAEMACRRVQTEASLKKLT